MKEYVRDAALLQFSDPPVSQVRVSLVYQPIAIRPVQLPALISLFTDTHPVLVDGPNRPVRIALGEDSGSFGFRVELGNEPALPRLRFSSADGSSWVEIQSDMLTCGWTRIEDGTYPRFGSIREDFIHIAQRFEKFVGDQEDIGVNQVSVTYVNRVEHGQGGALSGLSDVLVSTQVAGSSLDSFPSLSEISSSYEFEYKDQDGDAFAILEAKAICRDDVLDYSLEYAGDPFVRYWGRDLAPFDAILGFIDEGHDEIVRLFGETTRPKWHEKWGIH